METEMSGSGKEGVTMQKHIERPVHLSKTHRADERKQEVWPLSAREFMKLPVSGLMSVTVRPGTL